MEPSSQSHHPPSTYAYTFGNGGRRAHEYDIVFWDDRTKEVMDTGCSEPGYWVLDGSGETDFKGLRKAADWKLKELSLRGTLLSQVSRAGHNCVGCVSHSTALSQASPVLILNLLLRHHRS